jgi:hypothetical protein
MQQLRQDFKFRETFFSQKENYTNCPQHYGRGGGVFKLNPPPIHPLRYYCQKHKRALDEDNFQRLKGESKEHMHCSNNVSKKYLSKYK